MGTRLIIRDPVGDLLFEAVLESDRESPLSPPQQDAQSRAGAYGSTIPQRSPFFEVARRTKCRGDLADDTLGGEE